VSEITPPEEDGLSICSASMASPTSAVVSPDQSKFGLTKEQASQYLSGYQVYGNKSRRFRLVSRFIGKQWHLFS